MKKLIYLFVFIFCGLTFSNCSSDDDSTGGVVMNENCPDEDVFDLVQQKCGIPACHGGPQSPNFNSVGDINSNKSRIFARASNRTMPPPSSGISLTDDEIDLISCWAN